MGSIAHYIGADVHSRSCFFVVMNRSGQITRREKIATTEKDALGFIRSLRGKKALTFEEGALSQWLYLVTKPVVDELVVCNPAANKRQPGAKTDFRDAAELADLLRVGKLKPVFHDDSPLMELRTLVSGYEDVVQDLVRAKNRYKALYRLSAIPTSGRGFYADESRIEQLPTAAQRFVAAPLRVRIEILEECKQEYQRQFVRNQRRFKAIRLVSSVPGIAAVRANTIVAIVVEPRRFPGKYKFFSYSGLVSHRQMSDGRQYGSRRARGRNQLKNIFKSAAMDALRSDNAFRRKYDQMLSRGSGEKAARRAVARAIAATVLGVWKSGKKYNDNHREVTPRRPYKLGRGKVQTLRAVE